MQLKSDRIYLEAGRDGKTVYPYNVIVKMLRKVSDKQAQIFPELSIIFNCPCQ